MTVKDIPTWMLKRVLAGSVPVSAAPIDDLDINIDMSMPNFPTETEDDMPKPRRVFPRIKYKHGNNVRSKYIGWADYKSCQIEIPEFNEIMCKVNSRMKTKYAQAREALHRYIVNHEMFELEYMPQNELQHGTMEARNMSMLEYTDPEAYFAGLALHKKRLRDGSRNEKAFTKATSRHYDLGNAFKKYGAYLDEWVGLVSDVISGKPTYSHQSGSGDYKERGPASNVPEAYRKVA